MRTAIEGSQAIARALALCRLEVAAAYPITPQTHIVEGLAKLVADGKADCEIVSVESEFSAASVALGAAAAGSRAYCATASQGLLLMSEVLYNIAGLRVPLVLTCANRTVGAPINIWNDHQDSMALRDAGWVQLYCTDNQDAVDTTIQAFRIAERLEVPVMVCVDGFILTHLFEAIDVPDPAQVDGFLPPYRFSRTLDPQNPQTLGTLATPEYFTETRLGLHNALEAALGEIVEADRIWQEVTGRSSGALLQAEGDADASVGVLTLGSVFGTLCESLEDHPEVGPVRLLALRAFRPFPADALRAACEGLRELVVLERAMSPGIGPIVASEVRAALSEMPAPPRVHAFAAGLGGRNVPMDIVPRLVKACAAERPTRFAVIDADPSKLAPEVVPSAPIAAAEAPPDRPHTPVLRDRQARFAGLDPGHRACQGCGQALAARLVTEAAGPDVTIANATGCLEVFTTAWPQTAWRVPWIHSVFANAGAVASGVEAALRKKGRSTKVLAFAGDGGTFDIGFQAVSGMIERGHNVLFVCFDNEGYMNTGVQRSSSTPHAASTTTSPAGVARTGKRHLKKDLLSIMAAHHLPYAATATVAYPRDLYSKVRRAIGIEGPTFLMVHSPCPLGWQHDGEATIRVARMAVETGFFPIIEIERGHVTGVMGIREKKPVTEYLGLQGRFRHLLGDDPSAVEERTHLQALADYNIETYGLLSGKESESDSVGMARVRRGTFAAGGS